MDTANFAIAMGTVDDFLNTIGIAVVAMLFVLALIWLVLRYRARGGQASGFSRRDAATLEQISQIALRLEQRVAALEQVTAAETTPDSFYRRVG